MVAAIDGSRMAHGADVAKRLRKSPEGGIPWMAILDGDGKTLVTSDGPKGNIGYPAQPEEIDHFVEMLVKTATRLTAEQIGALEKSLREAAKGYMRR